MDVMRVPPYPIITTWDVPLANTDYVVYIEDLVDHSSIEVEVTSSQDKKVTYLLEQSDLQFDRKFLFRILTTSGLTVLDEDLDIVRPYTNPAKLATVSSEIAEYKMYEMIARSVIDSQIADGFYNEKRIIQGVGQGTDYFPLWIKVNKVLKIYENNVLIYDFETPGLSEFEYTLSLDKTSIQRVLTDLTDRSEQAPIGVPVARGDLGYYGYKNIGFPKGFDYTIIVDAGYKTIPSDVEKATLMLIEDLKCGKLDYYKRYVTSYNTDQFRIQFDKSMFDGTGNFIVDKILDKYSVGMSKPGIL
jgi:hypothetical protein